MITVSRTALNASRQSVSIIWVAAVYQICTNTTVDSGV
jgi:hypothetical protein